MNERDLDRIIDTATAEVIGHEPARTLRHAVMARVGEAERRRPRRLVWATLSVAAILCGVIAITFMSRTPAPSAANGDAPLTPRVADARPAGAAPTAPGGGRVVPAVQPAPPVARATLRGAPRPTLIPADLESSIESLTPEPLVLPSIELPPLENQAASVEGLEVEALTIEPLTASND